MGFTLEGFESFNREGKHPSSDSEMVTLLSKEGDVTRGSSLLLHGHDVSLGPLPTDSEGTRKALLVSVGIDPFSLVSNSMRIVKRHMRRQLSLSLSPSPVVGMGEEHREEVGVDGGGVSRVVEEGLGAKRPLAGRTVTSPRGSGE